MMTDTNKPRVVAIVQARMGSSRLPGKTLVDIEGQPLLAHILDRIRRAATIDDVVVATTTGPEDRPVIDLARACGVGAYAGSPDDVLDRYYQAAREAGADVVVRITADDPFKDPDVIDLVTSRLLADRGLDYASNTLKPTFPEGLDVEAFTFHALARAWRDARLPSEREHVTPYIWKQPDRFRLVNVRHDVDLSRLRWTLDYEEDLVFTREVYARLHHLGLFRMAEILALLAREPELAQINSNIARNVGYTKSQEKDAALN